MMEPASSPQSRTPEKAGAGSAAEAELRAALDEKTRAFESLKDQLERTRMRYGAVLRSTPHGLCILESNWRITYANHAMNTILNPMGNLTANLIEVEFESIFPSHEAFVAYREAAAAAVRRTGMDRREVVLRRLDGESFWCEISMVRHDPSATASGYVATLTDIQSRVAAMAELDRLASYPRLLPHPVVELALDGEIHYLNPEAERLFPDLRETGARHPFLTDLANQLLDSGHRAQDALLLETRVGPTWFEQFAHYVKEGDCYRVYGLNVTARKQAEERLRFHSLHDALTGLPNRSLFLDRLARTQVRLLRSPLNRFAVLYLDLDNFKTLNDSLGHAAGDRLLREMAERLQHCVRPEDTVARFGGDEFAVLLESIHTPETALLIARRLLEAVERPVDVGGHEIHLTASLGIAHSRPGPFDPQDFLRDADTAMYQAKRKGKNRCVAFDASMHEAAVYRLMQEVDLRRALQRNEFALYYQPLIDLQTDTLVGFEAVLRWNHPEKGVLEPDLFVHLAEETGLIVPVGYWVIRQACKQLRDWRERHGRGLRIHVNLSVRQFFDPDLIDRLQRVLVKNDLPPEALTLEITESVLLDFGPTTASLLNRLKQTGVRLAIDDFGTGYSSLSYLKQLPIDSLKVDRAFVAHMASDPKDLEIVRAVQALAKTFDLELFAEGIEDEQQYLALKSMGYRYAQGYFFAPPLIEAEAERMLAEGTSRLSKT